MAELISSLTRQQKAHTIVISDANDFGISRILTQLIGDEEASTIPLLTNGSYITESGCLQIAPYHWQKECVFCPPNLCKGNALSLYVQEHGPFDSIVYIGDGKNDICPATRFYNFCFDDLSLKGTKTNLHFINSVDCPRLTLFLPGRDSTWKELFWPVKGMGLK